MRDFVVLFCVLLFGWIYYAFSVSAENEKIAFGFKILLLVASFILAFVDVDFISVGCLAFGGRSAVMTLVLIEIIDSFVERKRNT